MPLFTFTCVSQISQIGQRQWAQLMGSDNPFSRYEFLHALENSGCVSIETGWQPMHVIVKLAQDEATFGTNIDAETNVVAVMPMYLKTHSYGEYVFDWAWAQAYERHQLNYYPKLVSAVPFTPVTGPRLAISTQLNAAQIQALLTQLSRYLEQQVARVAGSGWHQLFHPHAEHQRLASTGCLTRLGTQFHWHNRGYHDFNEFLAQMSSRKRKNILKDRRQLQDKSLHFRFVEGPQITGDALQHFVACYQATYFKRSGHSGYLNLAFFTQLVATMGAAIRLLLVSQQGEGGESMIAAALYFVSDNTLYGRYWGTLVELDGLHFEACYYQGIEYAITHGLKVFDAGAQGEHKVLRGFEPVETYSAHEIAHGQFRAAIADFTQQERAQVQHYMTQLKQALPYKKGQE